jgi:hypothetical protein
MLNDRKTLEISAGTSPVATVLLPTNAATISVVKLSSSWFGLLVSSVFLIQGLLRRI